MFTDRTLFPHQITFIDLILVVFCAKALMDFWNDSSLMAGWRAYFEAWGGRIGELSECRFCQAYHVCFWVAVLGRLLAAVLPPWLGLFILLVMFSLAATSVVHLISEINALILDKTKDDDDDPIKGIEMYPDVKPVESPVTKHEPQSILKMNGSDRDDFVT